MFGRGFKLADDVFAPTHFPSTRIFTAAMMRRLPRGGKVLEIGCGAGVTSVVLTKELGCRVTAVDINPRAVGNTLLNAEVNGVSGRLRVLHGDMFGPLPEDERFDGIIWNSNFVFAGEDDEYRTWLDYAFFDKGYRYHSRYLREGRKFLEADGQQLLGFSTFGELSKLEELADAAGLSLVKLEESGFNENGREGVYWIFKVDGRAEPLPRWR